MLGVVGNDTTPFEQEAPAVQEEPQIYVEWGANDVA